MQKVDNFKNRLHLEEEFELRSAHNQHHIDLLKQNIKDFLKHKYDQKFDELVEVIPKLNRFMCYCQQNPENYEKLSCPDDILKMDLMKNVKQYEGEPADIRPMTLEENYMYRNLIEDENIDEIAHLNRISKDISNEEKEKTLYKKFHDHLI